MDLADLIGLHILMTKIPGRGELKILIAGLGMNYVLLVNITELYHVMRTFGISITQLFYVMRTFGTSS